MGKKLYYLVLLIKWCLLGPIAYQMYIASYSQEWDKAAFCAILFLGIDQFYMKTNDTRGNLCTMCRKDS